MMGNASYLSIFKEVASILYGQNSLALRDIHSLVPFERHGMIDAFNMFTDEIEKKNEEERKKNK